MDGEGLWWKRELTICLVSCEILDAAEILGTSRTLKALAGSSSFGRRFIILCGLFGLFLRAIGGIVCGASLGNALADGTRVMDRRPIDFHFDVMNVMNIVVDETMSVAVAIAIAIAIAVAYSRRRLHARKLGWIWRWKRGELEFRIE